MCDWVEIKSFSCLTSVCERRPKLSAVFVDEKHKSSQKTDDQGTRTPVKKKSQWNQLTLTLYKTKDLITGKGTGHLSTWFLLGRPILTISIGLARRQKKRCYYKYSASFVSSLPYRNGRDIYRWLLLITYFKGRHSLIKNYNGINSS